MTKGHSMIFTLSTEHRAFKGFVDIVKTCRREGCRTHLSILTMDSNMVSETLSDGRFSEKLSIGMNLHVLDNKGAEAGRGVCMHFTQFKQVQVTITIPVGPVAPGSVVNPCSEIVLPGRHDVPGWTREICLCSTLDAAVLGIN